MLGCTSPGATKNKNRKSMSDRALHAFLRRMRHAARLLVRQLLLPTTDSQHPTPLALEMTMTATITATVVRIHETTSAARPTACSSSAGPETRRPGTSFFFTLLRALACAAA
jgi:hypothetical protein